MAQFLSGNKTTNAIAWLDKNETEYPESPIDPSEGENADSSFLWLRYFPRSLVKFMSPPMLLIPAVVLGGLYIFRKKQNFRVLTISFLINFRVG